MQNASEILIAEIRAIDPTIPIHVAESITDFLNEKMEKLKAELGLVKEVFVDNEPEAVVK